MEAGRVAAVPGGRISAAEVGVAMFRAAPVRPTDSTVDTGTAPVGAGETRSPGGTDGATVASVDGATVACVGPAVFGPAVSIIAPACGADVIPDAIFDVISLTSPC